MNRIGRLSSAVVWMLAVVVAWLERHADAEREAAPDRAGAPAADHSAPTRMAEPVATPTAEQPAQPTEAVLPESSVQPEQPPESNDPPTEPEHEPDQQTAAPEAEPASDDAPLPPTTAPPDVLAVAAGDVRTGAAERRHGRSVDGNGTRECPPDYPIKGNASSRIYHRPGDSSYAATIAEVCFVSAEDAEAEGFRPRKR